MHKIASYKSFNIIRAIFLGVTQSASKLPVYQPSVISSHLFSQNLNLRTIFFFQVCRFTRLEHLRLQAATAALLTKYIFSFFILFLWNFFHFWFTGKCDVSSRNSSTCQCSNLCKCQQDFSYLRMAKRFLWKCQQDISSLKMPTRFLISIKTRKPKVCTSAVMQWIRKPEIRKQSCIYVLPVFCSE